MKDSISGNHGVFLIMKRRKAMVKKIFLVLFVLMLFFSGCASSGQPTAKSPGTRAPRFSVKKVAIVALNVNNYGVYGAMGIIPPQLITDNMDNLLAMTESALGKYWSVRAVKDFINDESYYNLSLGRANKRYFAPKVSGKEMPVFSDIRQDVIRGVLTRDTAQELCETLAVDAVVLVYSEWSFQSGKFVPIIRAVTKNCISMYDKNGKHLFYDRRDVLGTRPIGGAYAGIHINEGTIDQWVESYKTGIEFVLRRNRKKVK
jgi:hypothetical protein